ncbi:MAG: hypothetical protein RIM99_09360 [Cyclobacteriaceae bacterium]
MYKIGSIILLFLIILMYSWTPLMQGKAIGYFLAIGYPMLIIIFGYKDFRKYYKALKEISYDKENLYVHEKNYEIQIPYHQIKDVEIISLGGLYKFHLYHTDQFGKEVICKPSIWYPLNYKKIDKELNRIRAMIRKAHHNYKEQIGIDKSLASFN